MAWSSSLVAQQRGNERGRARVEGVAVEVAVVVEVGAELRGVALVVGQALDYAVARTDDRRVAVVADTVGVGVAEAVVAAAADAQSTALRVGIARRRGYAGTGWTGRVWTSRVRASRIRASRTSRYCGWSCQQSFFFFTNPPVWPRGRIIFPSVIAINSPVVVVTPALVTARPVYTVEVTVVVVGVVNGAPAKFCVLVTVGYRIKGSVSTLKTNFKHGGTVNETEVRWPLGEFIQATLSRWAQMTGCYLPC